MTLKDLKPAVVWNNFYTITQIPRPSSHEEKISKYLYDWGIAHGLETTRDKVGNVIMRKKATKGYEDRKCVILQGHMDMVPAKSSDSKHNFLTDPIQPVIDGDWVRTNGTTLGADNGIGVSLALSVLESKDVKHGPLEAFFSVDEEQGMTGTFALEPGVLKGDILLNLDEEDDGALCVGCAGGVNVTATKKYKPVTEMPEGYKLYKLSADKGEGGHSGQDINLGRINANKSVARILLPLVEDYGCLMVNMKGGTLRNAIPIVCEAEVLVPKITEKTVIKEVEKMVADILAEHKVSDPKAEMTFTASKAKAKEYVKKADAMKFLRALMACPNGVERMSEFIEGLTETSTNMALVTIEGGEFFVKSLTRSSVDSAKDTLALREKAVFELIGCKVVLSGAYSGWRPNQQSEILEVCKKAGKTVYGKEPVVMATHGGLECGVLGGKYPNFDMIAFGPTIKYPHSPAEKLQISTVGNSFNFLCAILENIPRK